MPDERGPRKAAVAFIFVTVALDILALGIVAPVLPHLIGGFLGQDTTQTVRYMGLFATIWAVMQLLFSPLLGVLSDRFGRRPVILLSNFTMGLDYIVMAFAPNLAWLFVGRTFSGMASASAPTAMAYIADTTPPEKRSAAFGLMSAAFGVGFVLGPALGGLLGGYNDRLPFWVAGALSFLNTVYGMFVLPESLAPENRSALSFARANPFGPLTVLRKYPSLYGLAGVLFFGFVTHQIYPSIYVVYADYRYHWDERTVGFSLAGLAVCSAIVGAVMVKQLVQRFGDRFTMFLGLALGGIGFGLLGWASTGMLFCWGIPVMTLWGLAGPPGQSLMTRHVDLSEQGELQGAMSSLRGIAGLIGPGLFSGVFAWSIRPQIALPGAGFYLAAALLLASIVLGLFVTKSDQPHGT